MKVIFLDFDGVICTNESIIAARTFAKANKDGDRNLYSSKMIDRKLVENINKICEATDAVVVITSAWRHLHTMNELYLFLRRKGFRGKLEGRTPMWKEYKDMIGIKTTNDLTLFWEYERGNEINLWLEWNKDKNIESYIIIDDEVSDIEPLHKGKFIHTSMEKGFSGDDLLQEAIKKLKGEYHGNTSKENS